MQQNSNPGLNQAPTIEFMFEDYAMRRWEQEAPGYGPHAMPAHYAIVTSPRGTDYLAEYNGDTYSVRIKAGGRWSNERQAHDAPGAPQYLFDLPNVWDIGRAIANWEHHGIVQA